MPLRSVSSTSTVTTLVLPLPVMPTTTAWVVRWWARTSIGAGGPAPSSGNARLSAQERATD